MGNIAGAGLLSHVPTIMLPEKSRRALNEGDEICLVPGLERLRREVLDEVRPIPSWSSTPTGSPPWSSW